MSVFESSSDIKQDTTKLDVHHGGIVQVRTVVLIALLAIVRKVMILDLASTEALQLFALAAAILALGAVYWLVRDQDRSLERDQHRNLRRQSSA